MKHCEEAGVEMRSAPGLSRKIDPVERGIVPSGALGVHDVLTPAIADVGTLARTLRASVERHRAFQSALRANASDLTTGLPNQQQFVDQLGQLLALRLRQPWRDIGMSFAHATLLLDLLLYPGMSLVDGVGDFRWIYSARTPTLSVVAGVVHLAGLIAYIVLAWLQSRQSRREARAALTERFAGQQVTLRPEILARLAELEAAARVRRPRIGAPSLRFGAFTKLLRGMNGGLPTHSAPAQTHSFIRGDESAARIGPVPVPLESSLASRIEGGAGGHSAGPDFYGPRRLAAIQSSIFRSSTASGRAPVISTCAWNSRRSKRRPSARNAAALSVGGSWPQGQSTSWLKLCTSR